MSTSGGVLGRGLEPRGTGAERSNGRPDLKGILPSDGRLASASWRNRGGNHDSETVGYLIARSRQGRYRKSQAEWSPLHPPLAGGDTGVRRPQTKRSAALRDLASRRSLFGRRIPKRETVDGGAGCRGTGEVESCVPSPRSS